MIKPIIHLKPNQCPKCLGTLKFVETSHYEAELNEIGRQENGKEYFEPKLVCTKCGEEYDCKIHGFVYSIDYHLPVVKPIVKDYNPFYK